MRYRDAGVDVSRSDAIKDEVIREIRSTWGEGVVPLVGGFAGVMRFPGAPGLMAATMDGVGTKLHLAQTAGRLDDAAADLVYHGANDLLVHGARPLANRPGRQDVVALAHSSSPRPLTLVSLSLSRTLPGVK